MYETYKSWVDKLDINTDSNITVIGGFDVNKNLTAIKPLFPTFKEVSQDKSYKMYTISELEKYFIGGKIEVIKLPTDKKSFRDKYNNSSSHEYYNTEQLNELYAKYKGTHAIKVSYGKGFSKIIPVFEKYHTLEQLLKIINKDTNTKDDLKDRQNTGRFLGNKLLNVIQIRNVYKSLTPDEKKKYKKILTKIHTKIFTNSEEVTDEVKLKRSLKNIFRSHEVIGDEKSPDVINLRIKFINALIEDEENGGNKGIEAFFNSYPTNPSDSQIKTALEEAELVNNFYKKLKELTKNKFYVSVVLSDEIKESSQEDLVKLGLSQHPKDNLVTGFIVETPKLLLNLEEVMKAHKNSMNSGTQNTPKTTQTTKTTKGTQTTKTTKTTQAKPNNTQGNTAPNIVQSGDEIDGLISEFGEVAQTKDSIESLAESFLTKKDWKNSNEIIDKIREVYVILNDNNKKYINYFEGEYNDGAIVISEASIINEIKKCK